MNRPEINTNLFTRWRFILVDTGPAGNPGAIAARAPQCQRAIVRAMLLFASF